MDYEFMYSAHDPDSYDEDKMVIDRSPDISAKWYRNERYKRKVSHVIQSCYHIFCPYGRSRVKRYDLWQAMKNVNWRGHCRRGWYDPAFMKKLQNALVRYTGGTIPNGNYYRKIRNVHDMGRQEEQEY